MKIKRIIVICVCSLLTLFISVFVGLYTYGILGGWDKYQRSFVADYYDSLNNSKDIINTYVKFNSYNYNNHTNNIKLYEDYESSNTLIDCGDEIKLDHFTFSLYTLLGKGEFNKFDYDMFFYGIDNTEVNMNNIAVILFESLDQSDTSLLIQGIKDYKEKFLNDSLEPIYSNQTLDYISQNNFFDNGNLLFDLDGTAKVVNGKTLNRLIYDHSLSYTFGETNIKNIKSLSFCNFMIAELSYDNDSKPKDLDILCVGQIQNLKANEEEYKTSATNLQEGFGLDTLEALKTAGYTKYVMPKVIIASIVSFVIVGFLSVMFYITINQSWKKNNPDKKKDNRH